MGNLKLLIGKWERNLKIFRKFLCYLLHTERKTNSSLLKHCSVQVPMKSKAKRNLKYCNTFNNNDLILKMHRWFCTHVSVKTRFLNVKSPTSQLIDTKWKRKLSLYVIMADQWICSQMLLLTTADVADATMKSFNCFQQNG